jgi:hypothetical protein
MPLTHIPEFNKLVMKDLTDTQIGSIAANFINDSDTVDYFLNLLKTERPYSVYLSTSTNPIVDFTNVVIHSSDKWLPLINFKLNEMDGLLQMRNITTKEITGSISELMQVDPYTINMLKKENETPQAGNANLTGDTYLSRSEREESEFGVQESNKTASNAVNEQLSHVNDAVALDIFFKYAANIRNYMEQWLKEFDLKYLTI